MKFNIMKNKLSISMILVLLLINACANFQNPFLKNEKEEVGRGLRISFEKNTVPDVIYVGQDFPLSVLIENFGPALNARLRIYDQIDGDDIAFDETIPIPEATFNEDSLRRIRGKVIPGRISVPRDDKRVRYQESNVFDGAKANIHAELIAEGYPVNEMFPLCIKEEDVVGVPCSNNEVETFSDALTQYRPVTYSPVTISKVEKTATALGNGEYFISLDIVLSNVGGGEIYSGSSDSSSGANSIKSHSMKMPRVSFGREDLKCSPQNELVFVDNKALLNCVGTTQLQQGQEYVERITEISYEFNYKTRIKKGPIPIVKR